MSERRDVLATVRQLMRRATPDDDAELLKLMSAVPMEGELLVSTERGPRFFNLYDLQRATPEVYVFEEGGRLGGTGTLLFRDGLVEGERVKVAYLGDLRSAGFTRKSRLFPLAFGEVLDDASERMDCEHFVTGVMAHNQAALSALTRKRKRRAAQPSYHLFRRFDAVAVHFLWPKRAKTFSGLSVRTARPEDVASIVSFLAADHDQRPFGYRFDEGEFEHRLARWPGFDLDGTYLCHDESGVLVGVTTVWDPSAAKRYRVHGYRGSMRWTKRGLDLGARLLRFTPLPNPGEDFRYFYLCNLSIKNDDAILLRAMLSRIYADQHARGYHFFMLPLYEGDPLAPALKGFLTRRVPFHLYRVRPPRLAEPKPLEGRPGFEMALA